MLYSEFLKGTRAPETPDTHDQFQIIERIYTDCEGMDNFSALIQGHTGNKRTALYNAGRTTARENRCYQPSTDRDKR